jgi:ATP-dependent DNA helicase RecG
MINKPKWSRLRMDIQTSAQYIKGIGPKRYELLKELGIITLEDIFYYFPFRYEDRSHFKNIKDVQINSFETVQGEIVAISNVRTFRTRTSIFKALITDGTGYITGVWFNQPYLKRALKKGQRVILYGRVEVYDTLQINHPEYEILTGTEEDTIHTGRIVPIYQLKKNIPQKFIRSVVKHTMDGYAQYITDFLPPTIILYNKLIDLVSAIKNIHFPSDFAILSKARTRLVFDEFFIFQILFGIRKNNLNSVVKSISHNLDGPVFKNIYSSLPFKLTLAQQKVLRQIQTDMFAQKPMHRLLQGDVGSGKTVVAMLGASIACDGGCQSAFMVPTEILAQQHYSRLKPVFEKFGVQIGLLIGSLTPKERLRVRQDIKRGKINIIIGTHALIENKTIFKKLGLVIIDEQHKFGVAQRKILTMKGSLPDILIMTATPIPRTLALTLYADLDISVLDELPPGRHPVKTYWIDDTKRQRMYEFLKNKMREKNTVYVVYPLIKESEKVSLKAAENMHKEFVEIFKPFRVGLVHGKMAHWEKALVMKNFEQGLLDMLVSTTVLEVGVDVPHACVMVVEHAERFGLSQLHQLRGRVGRGQDESYCILVSDAKSDDAKKRLQAMVDTNDGFKIAEQDLSIRGPGEFFGNRQHGLPELRIGNLITDVRLLEQSRNAVSYCLKKDPNLTTDEFLKIRQILLRKFSGKLGLLAAG